jgi:hypothetical protein
MRLLILALLALAAGPAYAQTVPAYPAGPVSPAPDPGPISPAPWVPYAPEQDRRCADTVFYYSNLDICGHLQPAPAYNAALMQCVDRLSATRRDFDLCASAYNAVVKKCGKKCRRR